MQLPRFSMGIGDRFGRQGDFQLQAFREAAHSGIEVYPVWNKSNREHVTVGTEPESVRAEADAAVQAAGWSGPYFVDADHINLQTVDRYIETADFFTIDVGDVIGSGSEASDVDAFVARHRGSLQALDLSALGMEAGMTAEAVAKVARQYLGAVKQAAATYRHIAKLRGSRAFVTEVSMDETDLPQSPQEIFLILAALADEGVPVQTLAPKFSGRFNKGVDYVGDVKQFAAEFEADVLAVSAAIRAFGLPETLKLSVHSGSDKFAIYGSIADVLNRHGAGVHVKTAGTTWLAEVEGLIAAGGDGLVLARELYAEALEHRDELCAPYATVLDVRTEALPTAATVAAWDAETFGRALLHDGDCPEYNPDLRQLIHVAYKLAARKADRYFALLEDNRAVVGNRVRTNIAQHIQGVFGRA